MGYSWIKCDDLFPTFHLLLLSSDKIYVMFYIIVRCYQGHPYWFTRNTSASLTMVTDKRC